MAKYTIEDLKRINICPVLFEKGWDYNKGAELPLTFLYGIKEMFRWYYRRGKQISPDAITTSVSHHAFQTRTPFETKMNLETAFRKFASNGLYKRIEQPYYNYEILIHLGKDNVLTHKIPALSKVEKSVYIYSFDKGKVDEDLFLNDYETIILTFWSFFSLDKTPVFMNFYFDGENIVEQKIKVNNEYIRTIKEKIKKMPTNMQGGLLPVNPLTLMIVGSMEMLISMRL